MHACSVWGWLLYMVDDEALHLVFLRFELEAEPVLNDEEDRVAGIRIGVGGVEGMWMPSMFPTKPTFSPLSG
jgi:hypothetical protein